MALTKVSGGILDPGINVAGIVTATGFDGPFTGGSSKNITAGIITATGFDLNGNGDISGNLVIGGNLTANGDFTTLNTTLREVELLRVNTSDSAIAGIITQSGSGHALYVDGTTILGNSQYVPSLLASTQLVVSQLSGNTNSVDMTILGGRAGKSMIRFGDQDSNNRGSIQYHHSNESLNFYNNGNTSDPRLTIASGGTVGIGTDNPVAKLQLEHSGLNAELFRTWTTTGSVRREYFLKGPDSGNGNNPYRWCTGNSHSWEVDNDEKMRINHLGNVGIATDNPSVKLHVGGDFKVSNAGNGRVEIATETARTVFRGSAGIGIYGETGENNNATFSMHPTGSAVYTYQKFYNAAGNSYASFTCHAGSSLFFDSASNGSIYHRANGTGDHYFQNNGQHTLRIIDSGYVGIGSGTPSALLDVNKGSAATIQLKNTDTVNSMSLYIGASYNSIYSRGANSSTPRNFTIHQGNAEVLKIDTAGNLVLKDTVAQGNSLVNYIQANDVNGAAQYILGQVSSGNQDLYLQQSKNANLRFQTNASTRWKIDGNPGHLLPEVAGAVNIGSTGAEIGNVYLADDKRVYFGTDQDLSIYSSGSDSFFENSVGHTYFRNSSGTGGGLLFRSDGETHISNYVANEYRIKTFNQGAVELFFAAGTYSTPKLKTTATGVTVDGEVVTSQDYPNFRPTLDFNFAATKKLKPEMSFSRDGEASFHDGVGSVKFAADNEPRFEHDILTGECKGLMFEQAGTNYSWYSRRFDVTATASWVKVTGNLNVVANSHNAPDGTSSGNFMADTVSGANGTTFNGNVLRQQITAGAGVKHTLSVYVKLLTSTQATIYIRDGATGSTSTASAVNIKGWQRVVVTSNNALTNGTAHSFYIGNTNGDIAVWGSQIERSDYVTSYIKTEGGANGTRNPDKGVHLDGEDVTDVFNDGRGTLIAEAILTQSQSNNPIVGFYENFTDDNRVELRGDSSATGGARLEAVVSDSSVVSMTTGLGHSGINNVSKYAYAFELNNYAGCVNGGSVTTDTSGAFPSGMNSMMIGEAVYNVDAAVIVKRIMYYADRLPNSQLVTLTS